MKRPGFLLTLGVLTTFAACDFDDTPADDELEGEAAVEEAEEPMTEVGDAEDAEEARELVTEATQTTQAMSADAELQGLLAQARGVLLVPDYGRAGAVVGGQGGAGVLLVNQQGQWSGPAFYDLGGITLGAQLGAEGGEIALLLMTDEAVEQFRDGGSFSLDADAGLTLGDYSEREAATTMGDAGAHDVIFWSNAEGAFAGATLGVTGVTFDDEQTSAYYGQSVTVEQILNGQITSPEGDVLRQHLPMR